MVDPVPSAGMTARDVIDVLARRRWPDSDYLLIPEAPQTSGRQGRKIDLLVISLWASRGLERDAVEVKVSVADWHRELRNAEKADWWHQHTHRFWLATPAHLAPKVLDDLPTGWGLLSCAPDAVTVIERPKRRENPQEFTWPQTIGLMRAAADAGVGALQRAREEGRHAGEEAGRARALREMGNGSQDELRKKLERFEEITGLDFTKEYRDIEELAGAFTLATHWSQEPEQMARALDRFASSVGRLQRTALAASSEFRAAYQIPDKERT